MVFIAVGGIRARAPADRRLGGLLVRRFIVTAGDRLSRRLRRQLHRYLAGVAVLTGAAFYADYAAPLAFTVPDLLVLAGPAGLLAPVLVFAPAAAWRRHGPWADRLSPADGGTAGTGRRA